MTIKELQTIIKDIENSPLMTLELEMDDFKLKLSKNKVEHIQQAAPEQKKTLEAVEVKQTLYVEQTNGQHLKSPLVGTFYASPTINGNPYVEIGQNVTKGQIVCIIEAMKIMNEITSPYDGILKDVYIKNGDVVGYDQVLMVIE